MNEFKTWWRNQGAQFRDHNGHRTSCTLTAEQAYLAGQASVCGDNMYFIKACESYRNQIAELERERDSRIHPMVHQLVEDQLARVTAELKAQGDLRNHGAGESVAWMIECKNVFVGWWDGRTPLDCRFFDKDPNKGRRFETQAEAEQYIENYGNSCMVATEHIWLNTTPSIPAAEPVGEITEHGASFTKPMTIGTKLYTSPTTERRVPEPEWIARLRHELMMAKMTHNFTFSRDETIALLNAAPKQEETK